MAAGTIGDAAAMMPELVHRGQEALLQGAVDGDDDQAGAIVLPVAVRIQCGVEEKPFRHRIDAISERRPPVVRVLNGLTKVALPANGAGAGDLLRHGLIMMDKSRITHTLASAIRRITARIVFAASHGSPI